MADVRRSHSFTGTFRRRRRSILVVAAIALLASFLSAVPAGAADPADTIRIQNAKSRLCLAPAGGSGASNTAIVQYYCDNNTNRAWRQLYSPGTDGRSRIQNVATGQCLSPAGGGSGLNQTIVQYTCDQGQARYWQQ